MSEEAPNDPLRIFTFAGRLLIVATLLTAGGVFYWWVNVVNRDFPAGRYPIPFLLIPVIMGAATFFVLVSTILGRLGIPVYKQKNPPSDPPGSSSG